MYPFILNGLKEIGGNSTAPQHTETYIGGLINLIFLVAGQFAGAIATPEFLMYMDHFLRIDYGDDYYLHLEDIIESRKSGDIDLKKKIENWFSQIVYTINQPAGARGYQSVFWNIAYFDKYYFESIFKDFFFPDGDEPCWESTKVLQKLFMKWFNAERLKVLLTFPVETMNLLVDKETKKYADEEMADFACEMWAEGASFFMYQSDSVDSLSSCCRLRNGIEENLFSYTLGAGAIETGSKAVITMNLNRLVQDWARKNINRGLKPLELMKLTSGSKDSLSEYIASKTKDIAKYLRAFNAKLHDDYDSGMLTIYSAGFIDLDKQYLTVGINGFIEGAEFMGIKIDPRDEDYKLYAKEILKTISDVNKSERSPDARFNMEFVPAENLGAKNYKWDKEDGYVVPTSRNLYNSYFYIVEDNIDPVSKFFYQGEGFTTLCDGGSAYHCNLDEHLNKETYRKLMDVAVKAGCNYWTYNIPNSLCDDCGFITKQYVGECPKCHSKHLEYATRVIGYLKLISNFSRPRQDEARTRFYAEKDDIDLNK